MVEHLRDLAALAQGFFCPRFARPKKILRRVPCERSGLIPFKKVGAPTCVSAYPASTGPGLRTRSKGSRFEDHRIKTRVCARHAQWQRMSNSVMERASQTIPKGIGNLPSHSKRPSPLLDRLFHARAQVVDFFSDPPADLFDQVSAQILVLSRFEK